MFSPFNQKKKGSLGQLRTEEEFGLQGGSQDAVEEAMESAGKPGANEEPASPVFVNKAQMDKKSLDLIFAAEQLIQAKQLLEMSHHDLQDRLGHANGQIDRLGKDQRNLNKVIEEREKSIRELEQRLTDKNLRLDQVMEDHKELHASLSGEIEELKGAVEVERQKYAALFQKHNETLAERNKKISDLEEKNGKLEIELSHMKQRYEALRQEKTHLLNLVNDFTSRMTSPFVSSASGRDEASSE